MVDDAERGRWGVGVERWVRQQMKEVRKEVRGRFRGPEKEYSQERYLVSALDGLRTRALTEAPLTRKEMKEVPVFRGPEAEMQRRRWLRAHRG